jgi:hypothetical protein
LIERRWESQADYFAKTSKLVERAKAPLVSLIESSAKAKSAWVDLQRHKLKGIEARLAADQGYRLYGGGGDFPSLFPSLHAGVNVFAPPYDFRVIGPNRGDVQTEADRLTGTFEVTIPWGRGNARWATAGVGLTLKAGAQGMAHVRPAWRYDWQGIADGDIFDAHSEGAGRLVIQDVITGSVMLEQPIPFWNFDNDNWVDGNGYVDSWALAADVVVQAGQLFTITFLASGMVADSTGTLFGASWARAWIESQVQFVVVELGP